MSQQHHRTSSFTACFFPATNADEHPSAPPPPPPPPPISGKLNLTTCLYNTNFGVFSLTWSKTFLGHSLHLNLHPFDFAGSPLSDPSALSFHLHIKPFIFWKKHGSKNLVNNTSVIQIFWDLSRARFGSGPEPQSGFFIAVVVDGEIALLVGDSTKEAYAKTKTEKKLQKASQVVLRREHVLGNNKVYNTRVEFGGKRRQISIDYTGNSDAKMSFSVDDKRVLQIKRLKWKFRGNERIEVDGVPIQVSWDVYNWLFEDMNGRAVFMFRFENLNNQEEEKQQNEEVNSGHYLQQGSGSCSFGMSGIERRKMRKSLMRTARSSSSSSISMSSASSSGCSSSVMEWAASTEDNEFSSGPNAFSLMIYVWKK